MTLINAWWVRSDPSSDKAERRALVKCDGCLPPRLISDTAADMSAAGWEFDDLEAGPHFCPSCKRRPRPRRVHRKTPPQARPALPNVLIIGAAKCGTTSMHRYLGVHPEIYMSDPKELNFFQDPTCLERLDTYATFFDGSKAVRGEASPVYSAHPNAPGTPERIRAAIPDVKLIYLVRDPIERTISLHVQRLVINNRRRARTRNAYLNTLQEDLGDLADPRNRYVTTGRYATQLERYLARFPRERILVIDHADLLSNRRDTLRRAFQFLGVDEGFWSPQYKNVYNRGESKVRWTPVGQWLANSRSADAVRRFIPAAPRKALLAPVKRVATRRLEVEDLNETLRERLRDMFRGEVERLRELTGNEFASWQI